MNNISKYSDNDIIEWGIYFVDNKSNFYETSAEYNVPKSTIHFLIHSRLPEIQPNLYEKIKLQIKENEERIRFKKDSYYF